MQFTIPQPLQAEHAALHEELVRATKAGGKTGEAAKAVAQLMHPHFVKEEQYALPPLGLLAVIARTGVSAEMKPVLAMTDKLRAELPQMLAEHRQIVDALAELARTAHEEGKQDIGQFAAALRQHAETEEQVMYPAALLVGEMVRRALSS